MRFLVAEVASQVNSLQRYFKTGASPIAQRILERAGYISNLRVRIHDACLFHSTQRKSKGYDPQVLRAMETIASDLDRIAELCRDCLHHAGYLSRGKCLQHPAYRSMLKKLEKALRQIGKSIAKRDTETALKIGRVEQKLVRKHGKLMRYYTERLKKKRHTKDIIASLFVAHSIEQMGDAIRHISESIITANLGVPVDMYSYQSLQASMDRLSNGTPDEMVVETIAETRSGSGISGIGSSTGKSSEYVAIFKDGHKRKLKEEFEGVERWHELYPGLAPKVLSYDKHGDSASLLIEHLPGLTLESILLNESQALLDDALDCLGKVLKEVWNETRKNQPVYADHMEQLNKRLKDVYAVHPEFDQPSMLLSGKVLLSNADLVRRTMDLEKLLPAPFSVFIHGDFNLDNIIYDPDEKHINFIDVHRSRRMDYVQDISVFMVSTYRLRGLDRIHRQRSRQLAVRLYEFSRKQARKHRDNTFDIRLAIGLARSFATSTRFILDRTMARGMFMRSRYLMEKVLATPDDQYDKFTVPVKELFNA